MQVEVEMLHKALDISGYQELEESIQSLVNQLLWG